MAWTEATRANYRRAHDHRQNDVSDEEWALIAPLLPEQGRMGRPRSTDLRRVFDAIQYMLALGCQWRLIPPCYPPFSTVQNYFYAWSRGGVLESMLDALRDRARRLSGRSVHPTVAVIDSQSMKLLRKAPEVSKVFADGGYGGPKLRAALAQRGLSELVEIVEKPKQVKSFTVLHRRWVMERTFAWMARCRRLAKDFEGNEASSLAWARLAACRFLMRRVAREITT